MLANSLKCNSNDGVCRITSVLKVCEVGPEFGGHSIVLDEGSREGRVPSYQ